MMVYTDTRPLLQLYQEGPAPKPRRVFPRKTYLLFNERSKGIVAQGEFVNLRQAIRRWQPVPGQAIFSEESGDLMCCWRPA